MHKGKRFRESSLKFHKAKENKIWCSGETGIGSGWKEQVQSAFLSVTQREHKHPFCKEKTGFRTPAQTKGLD